MRLNVEGLFIKIAGVTSEEDALFAIGLGANAVGFDFGVSPRQISATNAHDIIRRLPQGALSVGSFRNEMPQRVVEISNTLGLSAVQLEGAWAGSQLAYVRERVNTVFRRIGVEGRGPEDADYLVVPEDDDHFALNAALDTLRTSDARRPVVASGGLDPTNVVDVVQNFPVFGVEARSAVEQRPGVKDPVRLGEFIANARWAFEHARVERDFNEWGL
ncbi:MAG: phosphoribosylanthranilate isomerase [Acidobacteriota bacterium]|nr:phosphoribosylanthranilate isomerase [Acidobacteriota bacterium]MDE3043395.1 phosphoribosylanthranilate isomerase [Acidobacteriota bacterium]MDE3221969.1 phosphoribosylanthranilate isomerase [Acidobacteriota bacterium]